MVEDQPNPYAPPAEPVHAFGDGGESYSQTDYGSERRPVIVCIGLTFVTLGFYPAIWLLKRQRFLDGLDATKKLGRLPLFVLIASALSIAVSFSKDAAPIRSLLSAIVAFGSLFANFRVLAILRSDAARSGRFLRFSTVATFFLGLYYLQYKINQLADIPAHVPRAKRKKKRRRPASEAPSTEAPHDAPLPAEDPPVR